MEETGRVLLSFANGEDFLTTNPFRVAAEIRRLVGEVKAAKPDSKGNLVITTFNRKQAVTLLQQDHFLDKRASFDCPERLNSVEAYAYAPTLTDVSNDEIIAELRDQGVIGIQRLRPKNGKTNPAIRLRILGTTIPAEIRAGFQDVPIRPWRRSPLLCRRCAAFGHTQKFCRASFLRCLRCAGQHATDDCGAARSHCPHCGGEHPAWDRQCQVLASHFEKEAPPAMRTPPPKKDAFTQTTRGNTRDAAVTAKPTVLSASTGTGHATSKTTAVQTNELPVFTEQATIIEEDTDLEEAQENARKFGRWLSDRTRAQRVAELPPAARTRASCKKTVDDINPPQDVAPPEAESAQPQETANNSQVEAEDPGWWRRRTGQDAGCAVVPPPVPERPGRRTPTNIEDTRPELTDPDLFPEVQKTNQAEDDHHQVFKYEDGSRPTRTVTRLFRYEVSVRVIDLDLRPGTRANRAATRGFYFDQTYGRRLYLLRPT